MTALRFAYLAALSAWLGGMVTLGAIVAPSVFQVLQASEPVAGRALAGEVFGEALVRFHYLAYTAGGVLLIALAGTARHPVRRQGVAVRTLIVTGMLLVALYSGIVVLGEIDAVQQAIGGLASALPATDPRRLRFDQLHQLSTRLMMINLAAALILVGLDARESRSGAPMV